MFNTGFLVLILDSYCLVVHEYELEKARREMEAYVIAGDFRCQRYKLGLGHDAYSVLIRCQRLLMAMQCSIRAIKQVMQRPNIIFKFHHNVHYP